MHPTKRLLLEAGLEALLERGYGSLAIQSLLDATHTPKGSFYHHFENKEDFALQCVDLYMDAVHAGLEAFLVDDDRPPLERVRRFFEATREKYQSEGYLGCMLGAVGQELSGVSDVFRLKIDDCLSTIGSEVATCLREAKSRDQLPEGADPQQMAMLLVNCWEGAALRSRLRRSADPLDEMLDFYFGLAIRS